MNWNRAAISALLAASSVLLAGCSAHIGDGAAAQPPTPTPATAQPLPAINITATDLEGCSSEPTKSRIEQSVTQSTISPKNSPLALPQDMGSYEKAMTQMNAWKALSAADRLYQLCFNYQQGSFGTNTPAP